MPLKVNANLIFRDYTPDEDGVVLHFECLDPGPEQPTDYYVRLTDADLAGVTTQAATTNLVKQRLQHKFRAMGISSKLDALVGGTIQV